ncbi:NAD-dependent epimerase/dehydratase family protein [Alteromonas aestuariivivens]|uniref:NAD-dependent epimerase/dehydratase family protein n=1 Tax=Alteromonas aestuariivivens TaxID=1938339 RepID=A0A3D8M345_9ALTE|nr:NAD(P)H-binding protein [Alteromonas aestuariivivens]RDV24036.1 NAD-dependent epimerase/dehydratase family protein [Alteromonas aestuariivivens]
MTSNKTALVLGATGLVGRALVRCLLLDPRYVQITCLVRRPIPFAFFSDPLKKLTPVVIDFENLQDYQGYFNVDHVYCCLGTTLKKAGNKEAFRKVDFEYVHVCAQLARAQRCQGFVWISSVGADANSNNFYLRVKGQLENAIMSMPQLQHAAAVRPSLLLGKREEKRPLEQFGQYVAPVVGMFMPGPLAKFKPVSAVEVANQMVRLQHF